MNETIHNKTIPLEAINSLIRSFTWIVSPRSKPLAEHQASKEFRGIEYYLSRLKDGDRGEEVTHPYDIETNNKALSTGKGQIVADYHHQGETFRLIINFDQKFLVATFLTEMSAYIQYMG